ENGRRIAYHQTAGKGPGVVFLGGFKSDMEGTKAIWLEAWAKAQGLAFLRLDYSGHGQSSGVFEEGCIGEWAEDAQAVIEARCKGPQVLIGSSMGGWISAILARKIPQYIAGIVGIAAAPDFTEDGMWQEFTAELRTQLMDTGQVALPSEYGEPYIITKKLIEDGRLHLVLREPLEFPFPVRLLQGTADRDVDTSVALHLLDHATGDDIRLTLVKGADHRFSSPACLQLIAETIEQVVKAAG
ncbi:MAG TPA: alpha/beta hydrolase, partial [Rhodobacteraceae bacterium]|nr:alpha/beta hydrolase [Paracoccaceae bacterium]